MPLYFYAIARADLPRLRLRGMADATVRRIRRGELLALTSEIAAAPAPAEETLRLHQSVLDELFARVAILPIRFGTLLVDAAEARRLLQRNTDVYLNALTSLDGKAEIGVKVVWPQNEPLRPPNQTGSGRLFLAGRLQYLAFLRAYQEKAAKAAAEVHRYLKTGAVAGLARTGRDNTLLVADYLVKKPQLDRFIGICATARTRWPDYTFTVTGPWPPSAFAGHFTRDIGQVASGREAKPEHDAAVLMGGERERLL